MELPGESVAVERHHDLDIAEDRVVGEDPLQIDGDHGREPSVAMHDGGGPAQFLDRLQHAAGEEDGPFVVVREIIALGVGQHGLAREIVVVVDEVDLYAGCRDRGHLDDQLVIVVVDDEVHAREADDLVQLVPALVDAAVAGHEGADFVSVFLHCLRQRTAKPGTLRFGKIGGDFLTDVQNLACHV